MDRNVERGTVGSRRAVRGTKVSREDVVRVLSTTEGRAGGRCVGGWDGVDDVSVCDGGVSDTYTAGGDGSGGGGNSCLSR